jgi:hypothetical protein
LVVLHAGCEKGFLTGCVFVFKSISTNGRDYHTEMNANLFEKWIKYQLLSALPRKQYNHYGQCLLREDGTKAPASNTRKCEMIPG